MDDRPQTLHALGLRGLLDEAIAIYASHTWRLIVLVAIIQVPVNLVSAVVLEALSSNVYLVAFVVFLRLLAEVVAYGAVVTAVGRHYIGLGIGVRDCYRRVWWRILTLAALSAIVTLALIVLPLVVLLKGQAFIGWFTVLVLIPVVALTIYWFLAVQPVLLESLTPMAALRRSYSLVRGSWWRVFGFAMLLGLVSLGLGILVTIIFAIPLWISGTSAGSAVGDSVLFLAGLAVTTAILPVISIASTLLYYDLRVRKEGYNLSRLLAEMGVAAAR